MTTIDVNVVEALTKRVEALERQRRRLTQGIIGIGILVAGVATAAQVAPQRPPSAAGVTGDRFTLVDAENRTRAVLEASGAQAFGDNAILTFFDQHGHPRIQLGLGPSGPILEVTDASGKTRNYFGPPTLRPATDH